MTSMDRTVEQLYQDIGGEAVATAGDDLAGRLLVYAEVEDGVISVSMFSATEGDVVRFRLGSRSLQDLVYALWEVWQQQPGNSEWRIMCYIVDETKFRVALTYPDQISEGQDRAARRRAAVEKYFGDAKVDYSRP